MDHTKCIINIETANKIYEQTGLKTFYVYNEAAIIKNIKELQDAFSWCNRYKGFKEFFAVKANPVAALVEIMIKNGCGCDCSSEAELDEAHYLNGDIMFSSNNTPSGEFAKTYRYGGIINLDDISHIDQLVSELNGEIPETICLRYNSGGTYVVSKNVMDTPKDAKYGMTRDQIFEATKRLINLGAKKIGLHAFLASNTLGNEYYPKLAGDLFELARDLNNEIHADIDFINLSGGIGIPYKPEDEKPDFYKIADGVKEKYEEILVPEGITPAIYTELGRAMTGPYGQLVTKVQHIKNTYKTYIGVDASVANLMRPAMYDAYHHADVLGKENEPHNFHFNITGSLCENNDQLAKDRDLPQIEIGDWIYICDAGAHGSAMGYNYNGRLHCAEYLCRSDGSIKLIKNAQTIEEYLRRQGFDYIEGVKDKIPEGLLQ